MPRLYSSRWCKLPESDYSTPIQEAVSELKSIVGSSSVEVIRLGDRRVGIAFEVDVPIPTRGPVAGIDIRDKEPILLLLHSIHYPYEAPLVCSDRPDFPVTRLPHLNFALQGRLGVFGGLCLHRGTLDDWFAEHSLRHLVERTRAWLSDAASGQLMRQDDRFEPARIQNDRIIGVAIYEPARLQQIVRKNWQEGKGQGALAFPCKVLSETPEKELFLKIDTSPCSDKTSTLRLNYLRDAGRDQRDRTSRAFLLWPNQDQVSDEYFGHLPDTLPEMEDFAQRHGLPLQSVLDRFRLEDLQWMVVIVAIPRPQRLIGSESSIELLNFLVCAEECPGSTEEKLKQEAAVRSMGNHVPMTVRLARKLSNLPAQSEGGRLVLFGCGALGSKIGLHIARAGLTSVSLVDPDSLSPHNLIRHALLADSVGQNKALALKSSIEAVYRDDPQNPQVKAIASDALQVLFGDHSLLLDESDWVLDCTASAVLSNAWVDWRLEEKSFRVMRTEIADQGRLGFLLVEGSERNPRLDDLEAALYDSAIEDDRIATWLQAHSRSINEDASAALEEISIGLGCSSDTMRVADDVISFHAASTALTAKNVVTSYSQQLSGVQISYWENGELPVGNVDFISVDKVLVLEPPQSRGWTVRMPEKLCTELDRQMNEALPDETGGLLVGFTHPKRKIIYITRALPPPSDSRGWPYAFRLGIKDVPETLRRIRKSTGGIVRYVGEWHSHPNGTNLLSAQDKRAVHQMLTHLKPAGRLVHVMIVTPKGCYPHLFGNL